MKQLLAWQVQRIPTQPVPARRRAAEILGRGAEAQVAVLFEAQGYTILANRLRTGAGEIDLVAANAARLRFVEVKARRCAADAAYAITPRQQARLLEAASLALALHPGWARGEISFDVALVSNGNVDILEDAIRYH